MISKQIKKFLYLEERFWPIVKTVRIRGPFQALRSGAKLVDLPGINDPNEAREEITKALSEGLPFRMDRLQH